MIDHRDIIYFRRRITSWGKSNYMNYPWRETDNMWHSLVAEIMLQKTRLIKVLRIYDLFIHKYPDAPSFLKSYQKENWNFFETLGLLKRYEMFIKMTEVITTKGMPNSKEDFKKLPGVGEYVASAMMSLHFGEREILIDSNISRFISRFEGFYHEEKTRKQKITANYLEKIVPKRNGIKSFNYALLDFSMIVCKPIPNCSNCMLKRKCASFDKRIDLMNGHIRAGG